MKKLFLLLTALVLTSCTVNFQNIDTHGTNTDVVDADLKTEPNVAPNINLP